MAGVFKFILYLGVLLGLAAFVKPSLDAYSPFVANLPPLTTKVLSFGGLALIVLGLVGRTATHKDEVEWK